MFLCHLTCLFIDWFWAYLSFSPPFDYFMPVIEILRNDVFNTLTGLNPRKAYVPDRIPPILLKNCASVLTPCLVKLFCHCPSTSTFPSCWKFANKQPVSKKGDRSEPSNYRPIASLKSLNLSLTRRFEDTYTLITFSLIVSMACVLVAQLAIFYLFFLTPGHPPLEVSVNSLLLPLTY